MWHLNFARFPKLDFNSRNSYRMAGFESAKPRPVIGRGTLIFSTLHRHPLNREILLHIYPSRGLRPSWVSDRDSLQAVRKDSHGEDGVDCVVLAPKVAHPSGLSRGQDQRIWLAGGGLGRKYRHDQSSPRFKPQAQI